MTLETSAQAELLKKYNLGKLPPAGDEQVGKYFNTLWEAARKEKIGRLALHQRWIELHAMYRGKRRKRAYPRVGANHLFKVVESYCATLTEKVPIADISADNADNPAMVKAFSQEAVAWWNDTEQQVSMHSSVLNMQILGTTVEKGVFNPETDQPEIVLRDNFNIFPAPGFRMCDMSLPYLCDVDLMEAWEIRATFGLPEEVTIPSDAEEQIVGKARETVRGGPAKSEGGQHYASNYATVSGETANEALKGKTLVVEIWIRDNSTVQEPVIEQMEITDDLGRPTGQFQEIDTGEINERPAYIDGIRKVVICPALMDNHQVKGVLDDSDNPNINWGLLDSRIALLVEQGLPGPVDEQTGQQGIVQFTEEEAAQFVYERAETSYPYWGEFMFSVIPSRVDTTQWWGFSILEQLEELQGKAELMLTKYLTALERQMFPILDLPSGCGVEKSEITNDIGIIIHSNPGVGQHIRYIEAPQPPNEYLEALRFILMDMDIISMTPEVTEGRRPKGISAGAAIIALQDKAATLFTPQVRQVDRLTRNRGRMWQHMKMNWDTTHKQVMVDGEPIKFRGIDVFSDFKYNVESGSSAPITKAGRRQQYVDLRKMGDMDRLSLLEYLDIPQAKLINERLAEAESVPGALEVLVQAGLPVEIAQRLLELIQGDQFAAKPQGGTTMPTGPNPQAGGYSEGMNAANSEMSTLREG